MPLNNSLEKGLSNVLHLSSSRSPVVMIFYTKQTLILKTVSRTPRTILQNETRERTTPEIWEGFTTALPYDLQQDVCFQYSAFSLQRKEDWIPFLQLDSLPERELVPDHCCLQIPSHSYFNFALWLTSWFDIWSKVFFQMSKSHTCYRYHFQMNILK